MKPKYYVSDLFRGHVFIHKEYDNTQLYVLNTNGDLILWLNNSKFFEMYKPMTLSDLIKNNWILSKMKISVPYREHVKEFLLQEIKSLTFS